MRSIPFRNQLGLFAAAAGVLSVSMCSIASADDTSQTSSATSAQQPDSMSRAVILNQLHHINQKEIQISKMALGKSQSAGVKSYAQKMLTDHQAADQKVQDLAKNEGVDLKSFSAADYEKVAMDNLDSLNGAQFDHAFVHAMENGHKHALYDLQADQHMTTDAQVSALIQAMIPTVQQHEKLAANLAASQQKQMAGEASENR